MTTNLDSAGMVVVGAGSAGTVIACRATERSDRDVLLIEAGPDYAAGGELPADLRDGTRNSWLAHDWGLAHRPTRKQVLFDFPRGRVVGGSSAVNTCIALRGQPHDYDEWAALGLPEWSFERCLPAFKRLENDLDIRNQWHGQDGPVPIRRHTPGELVPWQAAFQEACKELGFEACPDHNDPTLAGYGPHAMNKVNGERMSAARCYLTPEVRARQNLRILPKTLVRRVLFRNRRVIGLEVETDGVQRVVKSECVVLSGGAIATPGILIRSGIGPRRILEKLAVELVSDVPAVGARLLDHPGTAMILVPKPGVSSIDHPLLQSVLRYTSEHSPYPNDMQLQPGSLLPLARISFPVVTLMCCVGKPAAHGRLEFRSADPRSKPRIDSDFIENEADKARAVEAMELLWLLARKSPMRELASFFWPSEAVLSRRDRIHDWLPTASGSGYHPCGTVPMGADGDASSAIDSRGRVRGVTGLYVADASIMPTIPSYNINVPTLMIGERFGEWFRNGDI